MLKICLKQKQDSRQQTKEELLILEQNQDAQESNWICSFRLIC